jgi:hypothetical protein
MAGEEVVCPTCNLDHTVPTPSWAAKHDNFATDEPRKFSLVETVPLKYEKDKYFEMLKTATTQNCWEFGLASGLMITRVVPIRKQLVAEFRAIPDANQVREGKIAQRDHQEFMVDIYARTDEYTVILGSMHDLFKVTLHDAVYSDNIGAIVNFSHQLSDKLIRLLIFHLSLAEMKVPERKPYKVLHREAMKWAPEALARVEDYARYLGDLHMTGIGHWNPQLTLAPSSLHKFFQMADELCTADAVGG